MEGKFLLDKFVVRIYAPITLSDKESAKLCIQVEKALDDICFTDIIKQKFKDHNIPDNLLQIDVTPS